ncbi:hypothetical protein ACFQ9V_01860 [Leifsonia sp. NPDC056665]|uniref:hypothetical protein n=1 Tax=Leifsonia sp. NPDC056665 TaxID=3345901 RepID=UPI0036C6F120
MREVDHDAFVAAWATYWGRRELGIVIDNAAAARIEADSRRLRAFYDHWLEALRAYPADSSLRLMGTPALVPELVDAAEGDREVAGPRPAAFGPYAVGTSTGPRSERSGDYAIPVDPDSEGARAGRTLRRGTWALPLTIVALLTSWWVPLLSLAAAGWALALAVPVSRLFFTKRVPLRMHWRPLVVQLLACLAIVLAVVAVVPQFTHPRTPSKGAAAMSESVGSQTVARVLGRLRAHWPDAQVDFALSPDSPDQLENVRVRVSDHVVLEAMHTGPMWAVHPLTDASGRLVPVEPDRPYTIGVDVSAPPEEFADRFYEEVYFWWVKLHPGQDPAPPQLPA